MNVEDVNISDNLSDISTKYYLKIRIRGIEKFSEIFKKNADEFIELPNCSDMISASELATNFINQYFETIYDAGNDIIAYMVAKRK